MSEHEGITCELEYIGPPPPAGQYVWVARWSCMRTGSTRQAAIDNLRDAAEAVYVARVPKWEHDEVTAELRAALAAAESRVQRAEGRTAVADLEATPATLEATT